jgi:hypothetical protein
LAVGGERVGIERERHGRHLRGKSAIATNDQGENRQISGSGRADVGDYPD